jgi:hypothetical protein
MRQAFTMAACAATVLGAGVVFAAPPAPGSALTGMWQLNNHLSRAPKRPEGAGGQHFSGGFGGGGHHGGGMGGGYGDERPEGAEGGPEGGPEGGFGHEEAGGTHHSAAMFSAPETIKVDLDGTALRIISPDGHVRILTPDGTPVERERGFVTVTETARWDTGRLVVTSSTPNGRTITETFALADDGSGRLVHTVAMAQAASGESTTARWVYDRSPDAAAPQPVPH